MGVAHAAAIGLTAAVSVGLALLVRARPSSGPAVRGGLAAFLLAGAIGYVINWTGVWMLFYPVRFAGFRLPGLGPAVTLLPRRVQQIVSAPATGSAARAA